MLRTRTRLFLRCCRLFFHCFMTTTHNIQTYPCTCPHLPQALRAACIRLLYSSDAELLNQLACQPAVLLATRKKKKETVKNTLPRNAAQLKIRYQTTTYEYSYELHSIPIARYRWRALAAQDTSPKPRLRAEVSRKSKNQKRLRSSLQCRLSIPVSYTHLTLPTTPYV